MRRHRHDHPHLQVRGVRERAVALVELQRVSANHADAQPAEDHLHPSGAAVLALRGIALRMDHEAALAAARLGMETICFTVNLDSVGNMPCNPAIGGTGKGHLVRELDALGGEMGKAADQACIQYRMLNIGKGPAVHSLRAQADRRRYQEVMKHTLELQEHLLRNRF